MDIPLYVVDAFTNRHFQGNPAAICPLDAWLEDEVMQAIAAENNLSETAFLVPAGEAWELRWFTPTVEIDLCGHATLASAFVLSLDKATRAEQYRFLTKSGELSVRSSDDWFTLDFPARTLEAVNDDTALVGQVEAAVGIAPIDVTRAGTTVIARFRTEAEVVSLLPDFGRIHDIACHALIVTAPGTSHDFVSRFFAPRAGINEDPVTGSAHCGLIPYWHRITGKSELSARQVSRRGGELHCRYLGERVEMSGQAILFSKGKILL